MRNKFDIGIFLLYIILAVILYFICTYLVTIEYILKNEFFTSYLSSLALLTSALSIMYTIYNTSKYRLDSLTFKDRKEAVKSLLDLVKTCCLLSVEYKRNRITYWILDTILKTNNTEYHKDPESSDLATIESYPHIKRIKLIEKRDFFGNNDYFFDLPPKIRNELIDILKERKSTLELTNEEIKDIEKKLEKYLDQNS